MEYTWRVKTGQFQSGQSMYLNRILLGGYYWNGTQPQSAHDDSKNWVGELALPSLVKGMIYGHSEENIRAEMERAANSWFKEALTKIGGK